ncbi:MAG: hypothetical protein JST94_00245 [Bacteroidetes bacterium]|nr:hypothetical protein [Bacteroidota bacterium]MBS1669881.1 hypothetical protein [Bacteroidota bacterium]
MKNKNTMLLLFIVLLFNKSIAQKCDTLKIDGQPNPYGCPIKALNIYNAIHKKVVDAIFVPLSTATINYCSTNCKLDDWSYYNYKNEWANNPFKMLEGGFKPLPYQLQTSVPNNEETEPALFLANISSRELYYQYGNLPSVYLTQEINIDHIYLQKADSLKLYYKEKGLNEADMNDKLFPSYTAAAKLLFDESVYHIQQSIFTIEYMYNKTSIDLHPNDVEPTIKKIAFKLNNGVTVPYISFDNLVDVSAFNEADRKDAEIAKYTDYTKKPNAESKLGKQYVTWVQLGQNLPYQKTDKLREAADYSVYNFIVKIVGVSFEKNHEVLNKINWNSLYSIINIKKL